MASFAIFGICLLLFAIIFLHGIGHKITAKLSSGCLVLAVVGMAISGITTLVYKYTADNLDNANLSAPFTIGGAAVPVAAGAAAQPATPDPVVIGTRQVFVVPGGAPADTGATATVAAATVDLSTPEARLVFYCREFDARLRNLSDLAWYSQQEDQYLANWVFIRDDNNKGKPYIDALDNRIYALNEDYRLAYTYALKIVEEMAPLRSALSAYPRLVEGHPLHYDNNPNMSLLNGVHNDFYANGTPHEHYLACREYQAKLYQQLAQIKTALQSAWRT